LLHQLGQLAAITQGVDHGMDESGMDAQDLVDCWWELGHICGEE
jgi:hypothetical protein